MNKQGKQVTKEMEQPPTVLATTQPAMEAHAYPDEFLNMMMDYAYETLRQHLLATHASQEAQMLLEDMIIMHTIQLVYCKDQQVAYYWNQNAGETIGHISQAVIRLGGRFAPAPLDMIRT